MIRSWRFLTIMLAAFSLSLSMAHLLELPQRMQFDRDLWVRVTVIEGVYKYFGLAGSVFEFGSILTAFVLAFLLRGRGATFCLSLGGAICLTLAFASWLMFVAPANAELATWLSDPVPADWSNWRDQWEYTHATNALIKIGGFSLLVWSVIVETQRRSTPASTRSR